MNNKTTEEKTLYNIFNNKTIKKELLEHKKLTSLILTKERYKSYLYDRRNTIRILANDTNNHSLIVLFKHNKYDVVYNYNRTDQVFTHDHKYHVEVM